MKIPKHRVFISFHSKDKDFKDALLDLNKTYDLFEDWSVNDGDIDDTNMNDEQIRVKIRDEFIRDATVLILLCGKETRKRKFIDWELHAAMYDSELNPKMGIVVINLPGCNNNNVISATLEEEDIILPDASWHIIKTEEEYRELYPDTPDRIIDSLVNKNSKISFVNWDRIFDYPEALKELIQNAFERRKNVEYDLSKPLRRNNS